MSIANELNLFDCNCIIGRVGARKYDSPHTAKQLLEEMDYADIKEALVYHAMARDYDGKTGNGILLEDIGFSERLHPMFVLIPEHTGEIGDPEKAVQEMIEEGCRAVMMFPTKHGFSVSGWNSGNILRILEDNRIPLFIDAEQINWDSAYEVMKSHPRLSLVAINGGYRIDRYVYPLMEQFKNFYIETCWYGVSNGIERIVKKFGPERLLFGTNMLNFGPGVGMTNLLYADISMSDKKLIGGDNLRGLLCLKKS